MDQRGVSLGGTLFSGFPPYTYRPPWYMYQQVMPPLYHGSSYWFRNYEAEPATLSQRPTGIGTPIELCSTVVIGSGIKGQLQVVDESRVQPQHLEEDFSTNAGNEENELPPNVLPKENTFATSNTSEQNAPCEEKAEVPDEAQVPEEFHEVVYDRNLPKSSSSMTGFYHRNGIPHQPQRHWIDSIVQEPHHILYDAVEMLGERLNVLVTHVHHMASNSVKFHIETEVWKGKDQHRRLSLTKEQPVTDPSDHNRYPEAFDCRRILKHMRRHRNLHKYAELLDYHRSKDLKREIDGILGRIPGKWSPRPTWDSLFDTLHKMKSFIEQAAAGLRRNNEDTLAAELDTGYDTLEVIIAKAANAQQLSC